MFSFLRRSHEPTIPRAAENERVYAIGDIHGQAELLDGLMARIEDDIVAQNDERTPRIVFLGDYVDRGEASQAVVERVMAHRTAGAICLSGNHEAALLDFLDEPSAGVAWLDFGGLQTLASYGIAPPRSRDSATLRATAQSLAAAMGPHVTFFRSELTRTFESGNAVFVHAALEPGVPLDQQDGDVMLWGDAAFLERGWRAGRVVVHGHYAAAEPVERPGRICIDTGAYFSHCLTALRLDASHSYIQHSGADGRL